jgi:hypothetical protein
MGIKKHSDISSDLGMEQAVAMLIILMGILVLFLV